MKFIQLNENISNAHFLRKTIDYLKLNEWVVLLQEEVHIPNINFFYHVLNTTKISNEWDILLFPKMRIKTDSFTKKEIPPSMPRKVSKYFYQIYDTMDDFFILVFRPSNIPLYEQILYNLEMGPYKDNFLDFFDKKIIWSCFLALYSLKQLELFSKGYLSYKQDFLLHSTLEDKNDIINMFRLKEDINTDEYFKRIS